MKTKPSHKLTFRDRLSQLSFVEACKLLGPRGKQLITAGGKFEINIEEQVFLGHDLLRVRFDELDLHGVPIVASLTLKAESRNRLHFNSSVSDGADEYVGALLSLVLEEKTALRLAEPPPEPSTPIASLPPEELFHRALELRRERAKAERMKVEPASGDTPWGDFSVTALLSGKSYRVALRGLELGQSYCSCPDFRTNQLGTCKHILHLLEKAKKKFPEAQLKKPYKRRRISVYLRFGEEVSLRLGLPEKLSPEVAALVERYRDRPLPTGPALMKLLAALEQAGSPAHLYPDAEEFIQRDLIARRLSNLTEKVRRDPHNHPLRKTLLKTTLLPYQIDGVAFAAGAGRAVLADEMGLGKTIQGVGVAELLAREAGVRKVLVVCPASLKSQWAAEIRRFCGRDVQLVAGSGEDRGEQYASDCFFTVCNYEQVLRDILWVEREAWDLIILDEAQRIKNWESKTSRVIKGLRSRFALALTGTPLENRLDDLFSVVQFIDDRRLGPGYRFFNKHRITDERGKVLGFKNLADLREVLKEVLLRRTRQSVQLDIPERTVEYVRLPPTDEQRELNTAHMRVVAGIVRKAFITEMDLLRLRQALLMCRMAADSSCLVAKDKPTSSNKLAHLDEFLPRLFEEPDRKVIVFSEWTTMLDRIETLLHKHRLPFVRLDGCVPQKQRGALVHEFQNNPECKLFLTTNAGSTGLNLQAANTVINVDLPWNPAVLEQRIARAHRMGQKQQVQVFVLVSEATLEENLLQTLGAKRDLALAALDTESELDSVELTSGVEELKSRLERLIGAQPEAPLDVSEKLRVQAELKVGEQRDRVAAAGGELLGAAFKFLGELIASQAPPAPAPPAGKQAEPSPLVGQVRASLEQCVQADAQGRQQLTVTLPDRNALDALAGALAQLLAASKPPGSP